MYVKPKKMIWGAPGDSDVVGYVVRWSVPPTVINYDPTVNPGFNVGNVTQVNLPLTGMPIIDGEMTIGLTAVDDVGNESDPAEITVPFDFQPPGAPVNLVVS